MTRPCESCKSIKDPAEHYSFQGPKGLYSRFLCLACRDRFRKELISKANKSRILERIRGWFK